MKRRPSLSCQLESLEPRLLLDGVTTADPTQYAQYMLQVLNYVRAHPAAAATSYGKDLNSGLPSGTITTDAKQPLAFNPSLVFTALNHDQWMIANNVFSTVESTGPYAALSSGARMHTVLPTLPAGNTGENIDWMAVPVTLPQQFDLTSGTIALLKDMFIDTSNLARRLNMMDDHFKEVGIAIAPTSLFAGKPAIVTTLDFGLESGESFITGAAYTDLNADLFYTPGEGIGGGITVTATSIDGSVTRTTTAWSSGGYSLQVPDGSYNLVFSGGDLTQQYLIPTVVVSGRNVQRDLDTTNPPPQIDLTVPNAAKKVLYSRPGTTFTFTPPVANVGALGDTQSFTVSLYIGSSSTVTTDDTLLDSYTIASLGAGKTNKTVRTLTAPDAPGVYYFNILADSGEKITEGKEGNNWGNVVKLIVGEPDLQTQITKTTFAGLMVPGDSGSVTFTVKNTGTITAVGKINIEVWAVADASTPHADVKLTTLVKSISLAPAGSSGASVAVSAPIKLTDALPAGQWHFEVKVDTTNVIDESDDTNNSFTAADAHELVWQFGTFAGRKNVKLTLHDASAHAVTFGLTGGYGVVSAGSGLGDLTLYDTGVKSIFTATALASVHVGIGNLTVLGHINTISGAALDVAGLVDVSGGIAVLKLGRLDYATDQPLLLYSDPLLVVSPALRTTVSLGYVRNVTLDANHLLLKSLSAVAWDDEPGTTPDALLAGAIGSITVKGKKAAVGSPAIVGNFAPNLTIDHAIGAVTVSGSVSGAWSAEKITSLKIGGDLSNDLTLSLPFSAKISDLGSLTVGGWIRDSKIRAAGKIGAVTAAGIDSSLLFAGLDLAATDLPTSFGVQASIASVKITGKVSSTGYSVIHPLVSAYAVGPVSLRYAAPANGTAWGIATHKLTKFSYVSSGLSYTWPNKSDAKPIVPGDMTMSVI